MDLSSPKLRIVKKDKEAYCVQIASTIPAFHKAVFPENPQENCVYDPKSDVLSLVVDLTESPDTMEPSSVQWDLKIPMNMIPTSKTQLAIEIQKKGDPKRSLKGIITLKHLDTK